MACVVTYHYTTFSGAIHYFFKKLGKWCKKTNTAAENPIINSTGAFSGGFIGAAKNDMTGLTISNSSVDGYTIESSNHAGGAVGYWSKSVLALNNVTIENCKIQAKNDKKYAGGLVGQLDNQAAAHLYGYNVLAKNLDIKGNAGQGTICGETTKVEQTIKLAVFSRQDDQDTSTMTAALVGKSHTSTKPYGEGGYVIFADYTDEASTVGNKDFSNIIPADTNDVYSSEATKAIKTETNVVYKGIIDPDMGAITLGDTVGDPSVVESEVVAIDTPTKTEKSAVVVKEEEVPGETEYGFKLNRSGYKYTINNLRK